MGQIEAWKRKKTKQEGSNDNWKLEKKSETKKNESKSGYPWNRSKGMSDVYGG